MKVVYTAPNRAHHYFYAKALNEAGILKAFVNGFSRLSPRSRLPELGNKLRRVDLLQTLFLLTLKLRLPDRISAYLAYYAKVEQDWACKKYLKGSDIFLFYNGSGLATCRYAKKKRIVTIVEVVNTHVDYQEKILKEEYEHLNLPFTPFYAREKERRIKEYAEADYIMYPSEFVKKTFIEYGFPESKLVKVSYGYNSFQHGCTSQQKEDGVFTVLYVGSISVRKGLRYLIQAFHKLQHAGKRLVIVGPPSQLSGFEDLTLSDKIVFTGALKEEALENAYRSADVFCLPSIEDGFGLVIGEALSYGVPVITTTNTGAFEVIEDGKNGFIVPIRDVDAIYNKMKLLADDNRLLQSMKEAAVVTSKKLNGWSTSKEQLISTLYQCKKSNYE